MNHFRLYRLTIDRLNTSSKFIVLTLGTDSDMFDLNSQPTLVRCAHHSACHNPNCEFRIPEATYKKVLANGLVYVEIMEGGSKGQSQEMPVITAQLRKLSTEETSIRIFGSSKARRLASISTTNIIELVHTRI